MRTRKAPVGKFHDAQPGWLFGHGGIARRSIETCASCHAQNFCLTCHSATSGWQINPHGSHFEPERLEQEQGDVPALPHDGDSDPVRKRPDMSDA